CEEAALDRWQLGSADGANDTRPREGSGEDPGEIGRLLQAEDYGRHVLADAVPGRGDVHRLRELGPYPGGCVLELEAMAEDEVVALRTVLAEVFLEGRRCRHLDVADVSAEGVADAKESLVGAGVPGVVGDRPWGEECDLEGGLTICRGARRVAGSARCQQENVEKCGERPR